MKWIHSDKELDEFFEHANEYKSAVMLPSLTVVVVSRKDILVFDTSCVNFIDGWILLACSKNASSSLSPCIFDVW
jgi:hypothetical protein